MKEALIVKALSTYIELLLWAFFQQRAGVSQWDSAWRPPGTEKGDHLGLGGVDI